MQVHVLLWHTFVKDVYEGARKLCGPDPTHGMGRELKIIYVLHTMSVVPRYVRVVLTECGSATNQQLGAIITMAGWPRQCW